MQQNQSSQAPPFISLGGKGSLLHFSHANGYPPLAYSAFLKQFTDSHEVVASLHRPLWQPSPDPSSLRSWQVFGDDLQQLANTFDRPMLSVGHSMGAAAILIAAARQPELFKAIVLIEPVLVPRRYLLALRLFGRLAKNRIPLVRKTLARVDCWSDRQQAFEHLRPKPVFSRITDEVMWDYIQHAVDETEDGSFRLSYSKTWEAQCYTRVHSLWHLLPQISVPVLAIRGQQSDTIFPAAWNKWQSRWPHHDFLEVEAAGHLLPFEQPQQLALAIQDWLDKL